MFFLPVVVVVVVGEGKRKKEEVNGYGRDWVLRWFGDGPPFYFFLGGLLMI